MRLRFGTLVIGVFLFGAALVLAATAQNPDAMMPEQSAAKAKQLLQQLIDALGGENYLYVKESECQGRRARFDNNGEFIEYMNFKSYRRFPDKSRTDYSKKGNIVDVFSGDQGWTLDREGVSEEPASALNEFHEQLKRNADYLLRMRLKEEGMAFRYGGNDTVDLRPVEWVEISDRDQRTFRLAIDRTSHFLLRSVVITNDETTREHSEEVTLYSNYQLKDGVWTPLQVTRERDGRRIYQIFYDYCKFNPGLPEDFFTRAALEKRSTEVGTKRSKKDKS